MHLWLMCSRLARGSWSQSNRQAFPENHGGASCPDSLHNHKPVRIWSKHVREVVNIARLDRAAFETSDGTRTQAVSRETADAAARRSFVLVRPGSQGSPGCLAHDTYRTLLIGMHPIGRSRTRGRRWARCVRRGPSTTLSGLGGSREPDGSRRSVAGLPKTE